MKIIKRKIILLFIISIILFISLIVLIILYSKTNLSFILYLKLNKSVLITDKLKLPLIDKRKYQILNINNIEGIFINDEQLKNKIYFYYLIDIKNNDNYYSYLYQYFLYIKSNINKELNDLNANIKFNSKFGISYFYIEIEKKDAFKFLYQFFDMIYNNKILIEEFIYKKDMNLKKEIEEIKNILFYDNINNNIFDLNSIPFEIINNNFFNNSDKDYYQIFKDIFYIYLNPKNIKFSIISNKENYKIFYFFKQIFKKLDFKSNSLTNNDYYLDNYKNYLVNNFRKEFVISTSSQTNYFYIIFLCQNDNIFELNYLSYYYFISYILNYKGINSLFYNLNKINYIINFDSWIENFSLFSPKYLIIKFTLTEEGLKNVETIKNLFYNYLKILNNNNEYEKLYNEFIQINQQKFNYLNIDENLEFLNLITKNLFYFNHKNKKNIKNILYNKFNPNKFNLKEIKFYIESLLNLNYFANLILINKNLTNDHIQNNFIYNFNNRTYENINYLEFDISEYKINLFKKYNLEDEHNKEFDDYGFEEYDLNSLIFEIRKPNNYLSNVDYIFNINNKFSLLNYTPEFLYGNKNYEFYFKNDLSIQIPKIAFYIFFKYKYLSEILFNFIKYTIEINTYDIIDSGNKIKIIYIRNEGFYFQIEAYNDIYFDILKKLFSILFDKKLFCNIILKMI